VSNPLLRGAEISGYFPRMNFSGASRLFFFTSFIALLGAGCWPQPPASPQDEQKDPYFIVGQNRLKGRDFRGAIEAFTHAIENNPNSAAAHFELAILNEQNEKDFAAAIYHFQRYIMIRPNADKADVARQRIDACKQELAKSSLILFAPPNQQAQIDKLRQDMMTIAAERDALRREIESARAQLGRGFANSSNLPSAQSMITIKQPSAKPPGTTPAPDATRPQPPAPTPTPAPTKPETSSRKVHSVKAGETLGSIAKQHGLKAADIEAANPGVDSRRLRIGQSITIPAKARQ
jgi:LysM repeat protein